MQDRSAQGTGTARHRERSDAIQGHIRNAWEAALDRFATLAKTA